jgi:hypothetical protein
MGVLVSAVLDGYICLVAGALLSWLRNPVEAERCSGVMVNTDPAMKPKSFRPIPGMAFSLIPE